MFLYVVRHAWAGVFDPGVWPDDALRPLTPQGKDRFQCVARRLVASGCGPQKIATSPLLRCRQTAAILAEHLPQSPPVVELAALAPNSDLESLIRWTGEQGLEEVAWVGHLPDVAEMTAALIGDEGAQLRFAKAACAAIRFETQPELGRGILQWLATAKLLGC